MMTPAQVWAEAKQRHKTNPANVFSDISQKFTRRLTQRADSVS